jgi:hypothetical protein
MHKEMLEKDEQVSLLKTKLAMLKEMLEMDEQVSLLGDQSLPCTRRCWRRMNRSGL